MADPVVRRSPWLPRMAVATVLLGGLLAPVSALAAPPSAPPGRAAILFLPWPEAQGGDAELLRRLGDPRRGLAVGLTNPTVGGYAPEQFALDVSQGTRLPAGLYAGPPPSLALVPRPGGDRSATIARWPEVTARSAGGPARLEPGLLGETVGRAGKRLVYAGATGAADAAVAADLEGGVEAVPGPADSTWPGADVLVARLPAGPAGLEVLDRLLEARSPSDLVYVVRAAPAPAPRAPLLATGLAGPGFSAGGTLGSATTRRPGLVAGIDIAPTVLARIGVAVPKAMAGRPVEPRAGSGGAAAPARLRERLSAISSARAPALLALLVAWVAVVGALALAGGRADARAGARLGLLAALWFPGLALATAALMVGTGAPAAVEPALLALGSLALAALTDRVLPWPRGPALPAAVVLCAFALDLAGGSPLTSASLVGPNPAGGARFYGVGNELETLLSVSVLVGVGAATSVRGLPRGRVAAVFAVAGIVAAGILGSGALGADAGAAVTLGAGTAVAVACALPRGRAQGALIAAVLVAPVLAVLALAALDASTGADAHLSRSVLAAGPGGLSQALERRLATQLDLLGSPSGAGVAAVGLAVLIVLVAMRRRLLAPLNAAGAQPLSAGLAGALAAVIAGAMANDSAPDMLAIGAVLGLLTAVYVGAGEPGGRVRDT